MKFSTFNKNLNEEIQKVKDFAFLEAVGDVIVEGAKKGIEDYEKADYTDLADDEEDEGGAAEGIEKHKIVQGLIVKSTPANGSVSLPDVMDNQGYGSAGVESGAYFQTSLKPGATFNKLTDFSDPSKTYSIDHVKSFAGNNPIIMDGYVYRGKRASGEENKIAKVLSETSGLEKYFKPEGWYLAPGSKFGWPSDELLKKIDDSLVKASKEGKFDNDPEAKKFVLDFGLLVGRPGIEKETSNKSTPTLKSKTLGTLQKNMMRMDFEDFADDVLKNSKFVAIPLRQTDQDKKVKNRFVLFASDVQKVNNVLRLYKSYKQDESRLKRGMYSELKTSRTDLQWSNERILEAAQALGALADLRPQLDVLDKRFFAEVKRVNDAAKAEDPKAVEIAQEFKEKWMKNSYRNLASDKELKDAMDGVISALEKSKPILGQIADTMIGELKGQNGLEAFYKVAAYASSMSEFKKDILDSVFGNDLKFVINSKENELNKIKKLVSDIVQASGGNSKSKVATFDIVFTDKNYDQLSDLLSLIYGRIKDQGVTPENTLVPNEDNGVIEVIKNGKPAAKLILASLKSKKNTANIGKITAAFSDVIDKASEILKNAMKSESFVFETEDGYEMPSFDQLMSYEYIFDDNTINESILGTAKEKIKKGLLFVKNLGKAAYEKIKQLVSKIKKWKDNVVSAIKTSIGAGFKKDVMSFLTMMDLSEGVINEADAEDGEDDDEEEVSFAGTDNSAQKIARQIAGLPSKKADTWWKNAIEKISARYNEGAKPIELFEYYHKVPTKQGTNLSTDTVLNLAGNWASVPVATKVGKLAGSLADEIDTFTEFASETKTEAAFGGVDLPIYRIYSFVKKGDKPYQYLHSKEVAKEKQKETTSTARKASKATKAFPSAIFSAVPVEDTKTGKKKEEIREKGGKGAGETGTFKNDPKKQQYTGYWVQYMWLLDDVVATDEGIVPRYTEYRIAQQRDGNLFVEAIKDGVPYSTVMTRVNKSNPQ